MPNNAPLRVRDSAPDPRVARTTHALGSALIELIQERDYDDITVQQILDRAGVGRATFYAHYRNKDDALHWNYGRLFDVMESLVARRSPAGRRLFPVEEFVSHIAEARELTAALRRAGRLEEAWSQFAGHAAGIIERRLASWPEVASTIPQSLVAPMLGGALIEMIRWSHEHPSASTPREMDRAFHELARGVLRKAR